ncbi:MAG: 50S ribosomal protein L35 [Chloroflexi bacterium]|jgi:large subunit ribosomal protein L35|nr:MAG: 50S ribosomal protein L35 [Chloroflexota bacterium]TMG37351.1 MAG: 50S ribosomal protein L35 [Chloroflexota bacterium]
MPKMRTHRATAKRFRLTKTGKVVRPHAQKSHLLGHKSPRRKRQYSKLLSLTTVDARRIRRVAPYL